MPDPQLRPHSVVSSSTRWGYAIVGWGATGFSSQSAGRDARCTTWVRGRNAVWCGLWPPCADLAGVAVIETRRKGRRAGPTEGRIRKVCFIATANATRGRADPHIVTATRRKLATAEAVAAVGRER